MRHGERRQSLDGYISLILDIGAEFLDCPSDKNPAPVIAANLALLCPGSYPLYSRISADFGHLILEAVENMDEMSAVVMEALDIELPFEVPLDAGRLERLHSAEVIHLPGDIGEIFCGTPVPELCTRLSEEMDLVEIVIVPYLRGDTCYGASPVICPRGVVLPPDEVLISFGHLAASMLSRHEAEMASAENREKYQALFTASCDAVLFLKDGVIIDANPKAVSLFGAGSCESLIGLRPGHISSLSQPDETGGIDSHTLARKVIREAEEGNIFPFEWAFRGLDGRFFDGEVSLSRVYIAGEVYLYAVIKDISERKRSDAAIIASEERFRQVVESSFNAIVTCDTEGIIMFASPSVERVLGFSPSEITGTCFSLLYAAPDDQERAMSLLQSVLKGEVINGRHFVFTGINGQTLHLSINANRLYSEGKVTGAMAIIQDLSDFYRAREAETEVQFRSYLFSAGFENNPLGMVLLYLSSDGARIVNWNTAMETLSGWKKETIIGSMAEDISPDEAPVDALMDLISRTHVSGESQTIRTECRLGDGNSRNLKWNSALIADPRGEGVYVMLIVLDETQRIRYEAKITESEEHYRNMTDSMAEPMLTLDPDLTVVLVNRAFRMFCDGLGFPTDIVGKPLSELYPSLAEKESAAVHRVFEKGEFKKEIRHMTLGSVPVWMEVTLVPVYHRGVVVQVVILMRDITAEYDLDILKKEAFEQIEKNMEQFAILNDHIRNPLQGIIGICELEGMEHLSQIHSQVDEIDRIIKLLDFGYIESEKVRDFLRKHYGMLES